MSRVDHQRTDSTSASWRGGLISLAFWAVLSAAAGLFALVVLAPRLVAWHDLSERYHDNEAIYRQMQDETQHLETIAFSLVHDPDYARRIAMQDLDLKPDQLLQVEVTDAPVVGTPPQQTSGESTGDSVIPLLRTFSEPGLWRTRGRWGAAGLCLIAFVCLNEGFFSRGPGRLLMDSGAGLLRRYRTRANNSRISDSR